MLLLKGCECWCCWAGSFFYLQVILVWLCCVIQQDAILQSDFSYRIQWAQTVSGPLNITAKRCPTDEIFNTKLNNAKSSCIHLTFTPANGCFLPFLPFLCSNVTAVCMQSDTGNCLWCGQGIILVAIPLQAACNLQSSNACSRVNVFQCSTRTVGLWSDYGATLDFLHVPIVEHIKLIEIILWSRSQVLYKQTHSATFQHPWQALNM